MNIRVTTLCVAVISFCAISVAAPKVYGKCERLNLDFPHGVGLKGARDKNKTGVPVTNYTINPVVYAANKRLDRDKDKIACERL